MRFEWGRAGAAELGRACAALVVVDVLSFTTAVDVAVGRGIRVHPFPWAGRAQAYASPIGATVATGRGSANPEHPWSLSPSALSVAPLVDDLVLPSPNGSAICAAAAPSGIPVVAACARNAAAVAAWLGGRGFGSSTAPVGVVAAGERWPDGSLRPCVEDLLGAAMVLDGLAEATGGLSVEAAVCLAARAGVPDPARAIRRCASGQELTVRGYRADVELAAQIGVSAVVPVLRAGAFTPAIA